MLESVSQTEICKEVTLTFCKNVICDSYFLFVSTSIWYRDPYKKLKWRRRFKPYYFLFLFHFPTWKFCDSMTAIESYSGIKAKSHVNFSQC